MTGLTLHPIALCFQLLSQILSNGNAHDIVNNSTVYLHHLQFIVDDFYVTTFGEEVPDAAIRHDQLSLNRCELYKDVQNVFICWFKWPMGCKGLSKFAVIKLI